MVGITGFGAYIPRSRLSRQAIVDAHQWSDPGLASRGKGERSMCNWDEDAVTMAVEAGRACVNGASNDPDAVYFASTSAPFSDRQNAGIVATALGLSEDLGSADLTSSQRAGTTALLQAFGAVSGRLYDNALVVASDHRHTPAASPGELAYGDGAAAISVGQTGILAEIVAAHTVTVDFVDHFRAEGEEFDYTWEERWIRDEGLTKIVPPCVEQALAKAGIEAGDVKQFILPSTIGRAVQTIARQLGIAPEAVAGNLDGKVGECGTAHALIMLIQALESAAGGDHIVVASFAQGCECLVLKITDQLADYASRYSLSDALAARIPESNYQKYLAFNDLIKIDRGMRAERDDYKTALTVNYRKRDMLTGLIGGKCTQCGTIQFPRTDICVNPQCQAVDSQDPHPFREEGAQILTWSADYLSYTPDPPSHYGMITFHNGGRFMTDFTDVKVGEIEVGMEVRMVFRIKTMDRLRGFPRYFWKACVVQP